MQALIAIAFSIFTILMPFVQGWCLKTQWTALNNARAVDFSFDGSMIAVATDGGQVRVYDAYTYAQKYSFAGSGNPNAIKFNIAGTYLVSGSSDGTMLFMNLLTGASSNINSNHSQVFGIDFTNNSLQMVSCGKDQDIKIWDSSTWPITNTINATGSITNDMRACEWTSDSKLITADSTGAVRILSSPYNLAAIFGSMVNYGGSSTIMAVAGKYTTYDFTVADGGGKKGWYSPDNTTPIYNVNKNTDTTSFARSLDYFMFGGTDKKVNFYNATTKALIQTISVSGNIMSSDFTTDGKYLVVGDDNPTVYVFAQICNMDCGSMSFMNLTTKVCELCSTYMEGCGSCYNNNTCAFCMQGYYLTTAKQCAACNTPTNMGGCAMCNSSTNCTSPFPGSYITATNLTATCSSAMPGCLICNTSAVCLECHNEYYVSLNKCVACNTIGTLPNCLKCYNNTYCTQCEIGYYRNTAVANTATCSRCATTCLDCSSLTVCYECVIGYYTTGATCLACSANCLACNNTNFCLDCATNYYITAAGLCTVCTTPCLSCSTSATSCLSCYPGFYYDGTSSCLACAAPCSTCSTSSTTCLTCVDSFYLSGTTCTQCNVTFPNCQTCNSSNCSVCLTGFYYDSTAAAAAQCKSCAVQMHACLLCSSSTACLFCSPGHYLSALTGNNSCQPCALGCTVCETSTNCTSCAVGYYFSSWTCPQCNPKCVTCVTSATNCLSCVVGFYLQAVGTCQACNATSAYCLACVLDSSSVVQCIQCGVGFYLNAGACTRCGSNCVTCSAASTCLTCELGNYFNSTDSTCRSCSPGCAECSINGTCKSCNVGYYLAGTTCTACSTLGCLTCGADLKCLSCTPGYYYISATKVCDLCANPLSNCLQCSASNVCTQCAYGYALTVSGANTICSSCSALAGCFHCSSLTTCLSCQSGYYLNGAICSSCPEGCRNCDSLTNCLSCGSAYFSGNLLGGANVGKCLRCESYLGGCDLCTNNTDCMDCQTGYYLSTTGTNAVCNLCESNIAACAYCNSSTLCTSCKGGYYLAANSLSCIQCSTTFTACRLCNQMGTACTDCQSSYYLSGANCLLCSGNLPGCQVCNGSSTCVECSSGYYLNSPNCQLCSSSMPGCIFCSSSSVCLQCEGGYYINSTFKCAPCSVVGCEVCVQSSPSSCVTCNSLYYKATPTTCSICRASIPGCLTCTDATTCSKCDVGYYQNGSPPPQCSLCSDAMQGCSICSSANTCLECKSMYFRNATSQCQMCSQPLIGCTFCTNGTVCLSCGAGYFKNSSSLCQSCTDITGCLVCKDSATCLFCDTGYYFSTYTCQPCSIISGCYSCISSTVCTSCIGGYALNSNSGCDVAQVQASTSKVTDLELKTFYVNRTTLKHYLYAKGMQFTKASVNWQSNLNLYVYNINGTKIPLTVISADWAKDNNYTLIIYTNNPIDYSTRTRKMPFARRLLSSLDLSDTKTGIQLSDSAIQQILPLYEHTGSLAVDYKLDNPEFYTSIITTDQVSTFPYYAIGATISALLLVIFVIKSLATVPKSTNQGNIIPHILAFKVGALLLFPTYVEYISYCSGFMYADFPWLNRFFGQRLADSRDSAPSAYTVFYTNMNLASMYLLALSVFILVISISLLISKSLPKHEQKMSSFMQFLYNFFSFGMFFAGCGSLQGAIDNPIQTVNVNGAFYIIGIFLYFALVCQCIYKLSQNKENNFWKVRILVKATLLSFSHNSPVYLLASAVVIDLILIAVQYQLNPYAKHYTKSWIFSNVTCDLALVLLVFLPIIQLTMILVSVSLFFVIVAQVIMHYQQTRENIIITKLQKTQIDKEYEQRNMWDLNVSTKELGKQTSANFYDKTKSTFMSNSNDNMKTMYKEDKKDDLQETQVFDPKYRRQRNYKKVRQQQRKLENMESIKVKASPFSNNEVENKEPNLTFMMEDIEDK